MECLRETGGCNTLLFSGLTQRHAVVFRFHRNPQQVAFERDARVSRRPHPRFIIRRNAQCLARDTHSRLRKGQVEIISRCGGDAVLLLRLEAVTGGVFELLGGQLAVNGVAQVQLAYQRAARRVGLLADGFDVSFGGLNLSVVSPISDANVQPREKFERGALIVGSGLGQLLAGNLNIEIPCSSQPQSGGQVNWIEIRFDLIC